MNYSNGTFAPGGGDGIITRVAGVAIAASALAVPAVAVVAHAADAAVGCSNKIQLIGLAGSGEIGTGNAATACLGQTVGTLQL